jgi:hypothetical protein
LQFYQAAAVVPHSTAFVIAGAAPTAAGTLIVDPWNDCCLKRVGRGEAYFVQPTRQILPRNKKGVRLFWWEEDAELLDL